MYPYPMAPMTYVDPRYIPTVPVVPMRQRNYFNRDDNYDDRTYSTEDTRSTEGSTSPSEASDRTKRHHHRSKPGINIRRHNKGELDQKWQQISKEAEPKVEYRFPPAPVHITVKRNPVQQDRTFIQPVIYPVPAHVPMVSYPDHRPVQLIVDPSHSVKPPALPAITVKVQTPMHRGRAQKPPPASDRYESESFRQPSREEKKKPVKKHRISSRSTVVEDYVPEMPKSPPERQPQTLSYHLVDKGVTTREMENETMDRTGTMPTNTKASSQMVTYRDRMRRYE